MKKLWLLFVVLCVTALAASPVIAADYQTARGGVEVMVQLNPLGPNNSIVAYVKFINTNKYRVEVNWMPVITCEGGSEGGWPVADFGVNAGETYVVNMWRSTACGQGGIKDIVVKMDVKKADP